MPLRTHFSMPAVQATRLHSLTAQVKSPALR